MYAYEIPFYYKYCIYEFIIFIIHFIIKLFKNKSIYFIIYVWYMLHYLHINIDSLH